MYKQLTEFFERKGIQNKEVLDHICSFFTLAKAKSKTILLDYNQVSNEYYFVNKSCIRLFTVNKEGIENSRYFAFEGSFVSALPSFIDQKTAE